MTMTEGVSIYKPVIPDTYAANIEVNRARALDRIDSRNKKARALNTDSQN